jgi:hypothetical protein
MNLSADDAAELTTRQSDFGAIDRDSRAIAGD